MKAALIDRLLAAQQAGQPVAVATELASGRQALVTDTASEGDLTLDPATLAAVRGAIEADASTTVTIGDTALFVEVYNPPLRLVVVGAVHIAQPLAPMAALAGYRVTVVDPRSAFAADERFPGVELSTEWPDEALARLRPDRRTAIVTLTHDPKLDDPALEAALRSDAFYVGALGSRKTHAARVGRLTEAGFDAAAIGRIKGPVGLAIGALSPAEIAISILAQITAVLHGAPLGDAAPERKPA
ncbi:MAG TPA: XdhC family protein [Stellaceae bacterium]|nr:XdhC family protein [Stellaceae bacterium]